MIIFKFMSGNAVFLDKITYIEYSKEYEEIKFYRHQENEFYQKCEDKEKAYEIISIITESIIHKKEDENLIIDFKQLLGETKNET